MTEKRRGLSNWREAISIVGLEGPPGVGKTEVLHEIQALCEEQLGGEAALIARYTTRPERPGEKSSDYIRVSLEELFLLGDGGHFMEYTVHPVIVNGDIYYTACPRTTAWIEPKEGAKLAVTLFGRVTPMVQKLDIPQMKTIFIWHPDKEVVKQRLLKRCKAHGEDPTYKLRVIDSYYDIRYQRLYDYVVLNDRTAKECAVDILKIAGLL